MLCWMQAVVCRAAGGAVAHAWCTHATSESKCGRKTDLAFGKGVPGNDAWLALFSGGPLDDLSSLAHEVAMPAIQLNIAIAAP